MSTKSKKLKIAFLLDSSLDFRGGVQQYVLVLSDYYKTLGHDVHFIVGESSKSKNKNVHSLSKNITVTFNGNKVNIPLPVKKSKILHLLSKHSFDVIHVQMPYSPLFAAKVIKYAPNTTVIVGTFHILPFGKIASLGTRLLALWLKQSLKKINQVICVSEANQVFFKKTFNKSSIVLPNMVNVDEFRPKNPKSRSFDPVKILYSGRLTERKGCKYLIEAVSLLHKQHPEIKITLQISGQGEQLDELQRVALNNGVEKIVKFTGFLSDQDKVKFMQEADIACFPAYAGESFGIVLLEAISAQSGVVLAGNNPGYSGVLKSIPESLVNVKNKKEFSEKLYRFITDDSFRKLVFTKQQKIIQDFDYKTVGNKIIYVYFDCIKVKNKA